MKICLLTAEHGYSFVNQASALAKGLAQFNVTTQITKVVNRTVPENAIREFSPDIVISVGSWDAYASLVAKPQQLGFKLLPWLVTDGPGQEYVQAYNKLPLILTASQHCKDVITSQGVEASRVRVLPEAVDADFWHPLDEDELLSFLRLLSIKKLNPRLDVPLRFDLEEVHRQGIPIIFTTGGSATGKGAREVMKALAKLNSAQSWIYLIKTWPSPGSFRNSSEELQLADELGIYENIRYIVGEYSDVFLRGLMNACTIYSAPSHYEGFGLPLVEAQMCGKPVVSLNATATKETIVPDKTGFLAEPDPAEPIPTANTDQLADYFKRLLNDPRLRHDMGQNARQHAQQKYHPKAVAGQLLEIINQTL